MKNRRSLSLRTLRVKLAGRSMGTHLELTSLFQHKASARRAQRRSPIPPVDAAEVHPWGKGDSVFLS